MKEIKYLFKTYLEKNKIGKEIQEKINIFNFETLKKNNDINNQENDKDKLSNNSNEKEGTIKNFSSINEFTIVWNVPQVSW